MLVHCPSGCEKACYDCLKDYYNVTYHKYLDRHLAVKVLEAFDDASAMISDIPPVVDVSSGTPEVTNTPEYKLAKLLQWHHFPAPVGQVRIDLPAVVGVPYTVADFCYTLPEGDQVAVFLDGLSTRIHGNAAQQQNDHLIRDALEDMGITVVVIAASDLADPQLRLLFMKKLARALGRRELAAVLEADRSWDTVQ